MQTIDLDNLRYKNVSGLSPEDAFEAGQSHPAIKNWKDKDFKGSLTPADEGMDTEFDITVRRCPANPANCPFRYPWTHIDRTPYFGCHAVDLPDGFYWGKYFDRGGSVRTQLCKKQ